MPEYPDGKRKGLSRDRLAGDRAQDEYVLLLAFLVLASAALFAGAGNSVKGIRSAAG